MTKAVKPESIPDGWDVRKLGEILKLNYGKGLPADNRIEGKYPVYGSNGVVGSHKQCLVKTEGIIVGRKGSAGLVHYSKNPFYPIDTTFYITQEDTSLHLPYLFYLLNYCKLSRIKGDVGVPGLNREMAYLEKVMYPPFFEQRNIAHILSKIQSAIEAQEKIIQTTTELKKALMQKLFTEGLKGEAQKETEIGLVPKSWEIKRVGDFCDIRSSSILFKDINKIKAQRETPIKVLALKVSDMNLAGNEDELKSSQIEFYLENEDNNIKNLIPPIALIFPKRGAAISTNKKRVTLHYSILDPNLMALLPTNKCNPNFLYLYFQQLDLRTISDKGLIPQLNKKDLMPVLVPLPSVDEQEEIVLTIKRIDAKIHINTDKLKILHSLFKSMLHHLMTGQIRVKDIRFS